MKKFVFVVFCCALFSYSFSQDSTSNKAKTQKIVISNRPADHFMFQLSSDHWQGMTDSISSLQKGFSRGFNAYFMFDKPFRSSPKYSIGFGLGISTSNITFQKASVDLKSTLPQLPFTSLSTANHFKKYKLATGYLEVPLEFRYTSNPEKVNKSWKFAIGARVGGLVNAHTKGKILQDKDNNTINSYTEKENDKRFINGTRLIGTARVGYGIISLFGAYQLNTVLKDGAGPSMHLYQIGIAISGL